MLKQPDTSSRPAKRQRFLPPQPGFQKKLSTIAEKTLPKIKKTHLFSTLQDIRIYSYPKSNQEEFFLAIKKSGDHIQYFTQDQDPQHYFKRWKLTLKEDDECYHCSLGTYPLTDDMSMSRFDRCIAIINQLNTAGFDNNDPTNSTQPVATNPYSPANSTQPVATNQHSPGSFPIPQIFEKPAIPQPVPLDSNASPERPDDDLMQEACNFLLSGA